MMKRIICLSFLLLVALSSIAEAGDILVYDANDQFLGVLITSVNRDNRTVTIHIPELNAQIDIEKWIVDGTGSILPYQGHDGISEYFYYVGNCTGTPYVDTYGQVIVERTIYRIQGTDSYQHYFMVIGPLISISVQSYFNYTQGICYPESASYQIDNALQVVEVPVNEIPLRFQLPFP